MRKQWSPPAVTLGWPSGSISALSLPLLLDIHAQNLSPWFDIQFWAQLLLEHLFLCAKSAIKLIKVTEEASVYWSTWPTTVPAGSDHYFHTECPSVRTYVRLSVRPSFRPSVPKLQNQATITAGRDCGLAEWIIDDSCLVFCNLNNSIFYFLLNLNVRTIICVWHESTKKGINSTALSK